MSQNIFDIEIASGFKPNGDNDYPLLRAKDVEVNKEGGRLDKLIPIVLTQEQYAKIYEGRADGVEITLDNGEVIKYDEQRVYFVKMITPQ